MDLRAHNQLFLLGLASMSVGCSVGENTESFGPMPVPAGTSAAPNPGDDADGSMSGGTSASADTTNSGDPGTDSSTPTAGPGNDSTTDSSPPGTTYGTYRSYYCPVYGDLYALCYMDPGLSEYYTEYCFETIALFEMLGATECIFAYEEQLACLTTLSCEQLMVKQPCPVETMALAALNCPFPR